MSAQQVAQSVRRSFDYLYFIQAGLAGPIKIGRSCDVTARLRILQSGNHCELRLIASLPARGWEETLWHRALQDDREIGEWFSPSSHLERAMAFAIEGGPWWEKLPTPIADTGGWESPDESEARDDWLDRMNDAVYDAWVGAGSPGFQEKEAA